MAYVTWFFVSKKKHICYKSRWLYSRKCKRYFHIEYDVSKIVYQQGFPDGYSLDIYDAVGEKHEEFDDTFNVAESDKIQQYFLNLKPDTPKYLRLFTAELIIEFFAIAVVIIVNIRKNRRKYLENCS